MDQSEDSRRRSVQFDEAVKDAIDAPGSDAGSILARAMPMQEEIDPKELQILEPVGTGGTAQVFRGIWRGTVVAIKQIDIQMRARAKEQLAFAREVAVLAKVNHVNVVRFCGVSYSNRPLRIVSEFCEGGTVFDMVHNSDVDLTWVQRHKMCTDVACAMRYLHGFQPQIIHRDLKSLNLLLAGVVEYETDIPLVKVTDFGSARMKDHVAEWNHLQMTIKAGTGHWMAPEVISGTKYDEKADVFSFSIVLFEILCDSLPFEEEEPEMAARLTTGGYRPNLDEVPEDCPTVLRGLMEVCWAHYAANRPSFEQILQTMRTVTLPAGAVPIPPTGGGNGGALDKSKFGTVSL